MREIEVDAEVTERIERFRPVLTEVAGLDPPDVDFGTAANTIMLRGLDLMLVEFFSQLDQATLQQSVELFYQKHPNCQPVERLNVTKNQLADVHVALSRRYPRPFFEFMFEMLKTNKWAEARKRAEKLFRRDDIERNGEG